MINLLILVVIHNAPITILVIYPIYSYRDLSTVNKEMHGVMNDLIYSL